MAFIITASGKRFYPLAPTVEMVELYDIAHHLGKVARWTGATLGDQTYSVAQHSVFVSMLCDQDPMIAMEGLHHDSSEAYLVDVARPLKHTEPFRSVYMKFEAQLTDVIFQKFGIEWDGTHHPSVKDADTRILVTEARDLMPEPDGGQLDWSEGHAVTSEEAFKRAYDFKIDQIWTPRQAREGFIARHIYLDNLIGGKTHDEALFSVWSYLQTTKERTTA